MELDPYNNITFTPQMIGQQLAEVLMTAIVNDEIHGGEKLVENQIKKKFGVSRSPIREAIRELEKIRLVEIIPRKGTFVKKITKKNIKEDLEVRAPLEGIAAREAYLNMDEKLLAQLDKALETMRTAAKKSNTSEFWSAHADFHNTFINSCGHELLTVLLPMLRIHSARSRNVYSIPSEDLEALFKPHEKILKMFKSSDTDVHALEKLVSSHIIDYLPLILSRIK